MVLDQMTVMCGHLPIGGSHMLICYGQTMEHNRVDTVGNQIMNEIQIIDITELTLLAPISVSMYRHDRIIELTELWIWPK